MRQDKEGALSLRLRGYSYNQITKRLGIPKATLSGWFTNLVLSQKAQLKIQQRVHKASLRGLIKKNKLQTHKAWQQAKCIQKDAMHDVRKLSQRELLLIGAALYWGEGYKKLIIKDGKERTSHKISLSNTDPSMIKLFIKFLQNILKIPTSKISINIRTFQHSNEQEVLRYWQGVTGLPKEQFEKVYYGISRSSLGKRPYNRLPYGTIQVSVGDTKNFHRIIGWIRGIKEFVH